MILCSGNWPRICSMMHFSAAKSAAQTILLESAFCRRLVILAKCSSNVVPAERTQFMTHCFITWLLSHFSCTRGWLMEDQAWVIELVQSLGRLTSIQASFACCLFLNAAIFSYS